MKKGFVLTMDAMVALILAAIFFTMIMYFVTAPKIKTEEYLYMVGGDFLTVADKEGSILSAVAGNTAAVDDFIDMMPDNICINLTVTNSSGYLFYKNDNGCKQSTKHVLVGRTIVNSTDDYIANVRVWYR